MSSTGYLPTSYLRLGFFRCLGAVRHTSPPLVLRILALELLFQAGVGFGPKRFEAARHLNRSVARGQDVESERMATECDFDIIRDSVKILDPG